MTLRFTEGNKAPNVAEASECRESLEDNDCLSELSYAEPESAESGYMSAGAVESATPMGELRQRFPIGSEVRCKDSVWNSRIHRACPTRDSQARKEVTGHRILEDGTRQIEFKWPTENGRRLGAPCRGYLDADMLELLAPS